MEWLVALPTYTVSRYTAALHCVLTAAGRYKCTANSTDTRIFTIIVCTYFQLRTNRPTYLYDGRMKIIICPMLGKNSQTVILLLFRFRHMHKKKLWQIICMRVHLWEHDKRLRPTFIVSLPAICVYLYTLSNNHFQLRRFFSTSLTTNHAVQTQSLLVWYYVGKHYIYGLDPVIAWSFLSFRKIEFYL